MHLFPYVHGHYVVNGTGDVVMAGGIEYLLLIGMFVWLSPLPAHSPQGFVIANVVMLAPFGAATGWLLGRLMGEGAVQFAAAPAVAWYSFLNWDLLGLACAVARVHFAVVQLDTDWKDV